MPLYEYQCDVCKSRFELIQRFSDPPADTCPSCGGAVRKLLSSPAIQFKGSGWYITDYARKGGGEASGSKDKAEATGGGSGASTDKAATDKASKAAATAESEGTQSKDSKASPSSR